MADHLEQNPLINLLIRQTLIKGFPCFATLSSTESHELAKLMREVHIQSGQQIVAENELIDSIYIIVSGEAEVTHEIKQGHKIIQTPIAALRATEGIGLNDTGFYSTTGKRTATVTAITDMLLLQLDIKDLYGFLAKYHLELSMHAASLQMMRMRFIKQSLPFATLSHARLQWLADRVEEVHIPAGTIIFHQDDAGDKCYLIRSGQIEILATNENREDHRLAILKSPALFGEATLMTHSTRNATARALTDCELLVLRHAYLSELIESENNVAHMFMTLMVDRSRPMQNPNVTVHNRKTADGQELTILKNKLNSNYFKLSIEGTFIWQQLDGKHTLQEITLALADQFNIFSPDMVVALISKLTKAGFIHNLDIHDESRFNARPLWVRAILHIQRLLETRIAFGDADRWITKTYENCIRYLFTRLGQFILALFAIAGIIAFVMSTPDVLLFFSFKHASLLLIIALIPLSLIEVILHELGHAYTAKAFGREVHFMGIGWYWVVPIAFTDTSDMWLSNRKLRMLVNIAGVYVDILVAGLSALLIFVIDNPYVQSLLWLFALYTYIGGFRMLSPLQEMDGYYILMDWVERNRLRQAAIIWLIKVFPQSLRHPTLFREYWPEVSYWLACIFYLILLSALTLLLQVFIFNILDIHANPYVSFILLFLVVIFSSLSVMADIKNQTDD